VCLPYDLRSQGFLPDDFLYYFVCPKFWTRRPCSTFDISMDPPEEKVNQNGEKIQRTKNVVQWSASTHLDQKIVGLNPRLGARCWKLMH
jgi:hypothetical protein